MERLQFPKYSFLPPRKYEGVYADEQSLLLKLEYQFGLISVFKTTYFQVLLLPSVVTIYKLQILFPLGT